MSKPIHAITQHGDDYKAVSLKQAGEQLEIIDFYQCERKSNDWNHIHQKISSNGQAWENIIGLDSKGIAFYHINTPDVDSQKLETIVRMQAESLLPLPQKDISYAWRPGQTSNGNIPVTIAVAKTSQLQNNINGINGLSPSKILLNPEAIVQGWLSFYDGNRDANQLIYITDNASVTCLINENKLIQAIYSDIGRKKLKNSQSEFNQFVEQLAHDLRDMNLTLSTNNTNKSLNTIILSNGDDFYKQIQSHLNERNIDAACTTPNMACFTGEKDVSPQIIHEFLPAVGLAYLSKAKQSQTFDLYQQLYHSPDKKSSKPNTPPVIITACLAAVLILTYFLISYFSDVRQLNYLENQLNSNESMNINQLIKENQVRKSIASQRIDLLDLLSKINQSNEQEVILDNMLYKKGQKIKLSGHIPQNSQAHFDFVDKLQATKGFSDVRLDNPVLDEKKKQLTFSITFDYQNFTKKKRSTTFKSKL